MRYGFVIDQTSCIGCHACTVACKEENRVPLGVFRTWVKYVEKGTFPDTRRHFAVLRCNHCDRAPCVTICPTRALFRRPDGIVDLDRDACIGCKSCLQACPYDALHIDPETDTAAKCHFCAHRIEKGLEPACVIVCPERAILAGDLDDPESVVSRAIARQPVAVRKPEQRTRPKLYYLGADAAALVPQMQEAGPAYLWAERPSFAMAAVRPTFAVASSGSPATAVRPPSTSAMAPGRIVYDVPHAPAPWGWRVSAYLWTKSIAAGAALVAALGALAGWPLSAELPLPAVAIAFLIATAVLLIADLKRPDRFALILRRPNLRSWLVWGAWILIAFGALAGAWLIAAAGAETALLPWLAWPLALLASAAAGYSAFLFAQAEGRGLWQSPFLLLLHLLAAASVAGASVALLAHGPSPALSTLALVALGVNLLLVLAECFLPHARPDAGAAARLITAGSWRLVFWAGVIGVGTVAPALLLVLSASREACGLAALLALAGLYLWEHCWVKAGQALPLS